MIMQEELEETNSCFTTTVASEIPQQTLLAMVQLAILKNPYAVDLNT